MLRLERVTAGYGAVEVLHEVTLEVPSGRVVGLLGPNGAGKSTIVRVVAGLVAPWSGAVLLDGDDVGNVPAHRRVGAGIAVVPEGRLVFAELTVEQNLRLGHHARRAVDSDRGACLDAVYSLFEPLAAFRDRRAGSLSGGEQQMLAIGRALMNRPRLLVIDELSLGLAPALIRRLLATVAQLAEEGIAVLVVEQNVRATLGVVDRVYVVLNGQVVQSGAPDEVAEAIEDRYLTATEARA